MKKSNTSAGAGKLPATGGGSPKPDAPSEEQPIGTFGTNVNAAPSAGGADKGVTVNVRCKLTIKNGAKVFGGAVVGGKVIGSPEDDDLELVLELEGSATVHGGENLLGGAGGGGENLFGGAVVGGRLIGSPEETGGGGRQRQSATTQRYEAAQSQGGSEAV